jgi:hypothetical protein
MRRPVWWLFVALVSGGCVYEPDNLPVTLTFPDFPENVAKVDLGQSLRIDADVANDDGGALPGAAREQAARRCKSRQPRSHLRRWGLPEKL